MMRSPGTGVPSTCVLLCSWDFLIEKIVFCEAAVDPKAHLLVIARRLVFVREVRNNTDILFIVTSAVI